MQMTTTGFGSSVLDLWIMQDTFKVERLELQLSDPKAGQAAFRLVMTNYDNVAPIYAPPPDQQDVATPAPTSASTAAS
jgi:hypothetical protein